MRSPATKVGSWPRSARGIVFGSCGAALQHERRVGRAVACAEAPCACSSASDSRASGSGGRHRRQAARGVVRHRQGRRVGREGTRRAARQVCDGRPGGFVESIIHDRPPASGRRAPPPPPVRRLGRPAGAQAPSTQWLAASRRRTVCGPPRVRLASADASFRRYLRVDARRGGADRIVMDAPPDQENSAPFVQVAQLMARRRRDARRGCSSGTRPQGFLLLDDLGTADHDRRDRPGRCRGRPAAVHAGRSMHLIRWQLASKPGVLPPYDQALLERELALFPEWYIERHRGVRVEGRLQERLERSFRLIVENNLAGAPRLRAPRLHAAQPDGPRSGEPHAGRAGFPGRGVRPDHLRHRQPDARRLPELGRGVRARHHRALLGAGAQGRAAGRRRTSARSIARSNGWACSAT